MSQRLRPGMSGKQGTKTPWETFQSVRLDEGTGAE